MAGRAALSLSIVLTLIASVPAAPSAATPTEHEAGASMSGEHVVSGSTPRRQLLFTFDDGPDPDWTLPLLQSLSEHRVRAVFFLVVRRLHRPNRVPWAREIGRRGHVLASHGWEHDRHDRLALDVLRQRFTDEDALFEATVGRRPVLFRPPYGMASARVVTAVQEKNRVLLGWNINPRDYSDRDPGRIVQHFVGELGVNERERGDRGGVVLMHQTHPASIEAFERIMAWIREENCALLARGEELYDVVDDPGYFVPRFAHRRLVPFEARQAAVVDEARVRCAGRPMSDGVSGER